MAYATSTQKLVKRYNTLKRKHPSLRLGQYFCNLYVKAFDGRTDPLFNQPNDDLAAIAIDQWMRDNQHLDELPMAVRVISYG